MYLLHSERQKINSYELLFSGYVYIYVHCTSTFNMYVFKNWWNTCYENLSILIFCFNAYKNITNANKFIFSDLVTGLLCCSTPGAGGYRPDLNMSLPDDLPLPVDIPLQADWRLGVGPWRDVRTMDWVQEVQGRALNPAYCSQDCGDGFCYNVWSNMVHV